jgi:hypothetical protein
MFAYHERGWWLADLAFQDKRHPVGWPEVIGRLIAVLLP